MHDPLPTEIVDALARIGHRARAARRISGLDLRQHPRAVYRVELVSGETIKARRLEDETTARALCAHRRGLPPAFVPVLAQHGRVLVEPWIEGASLRGRAPNPTQLAAAGALLAALHATPASADAGESMSHWRQRGAARLAALAAHGALTGDERARIAAALVRCDPGGAVAGLIHTDFCGENMVIDAAGTLHVIDNERIGVGALGYDLARTWARWELDDDAWSRFAAAYAAAGGGAAARVGQPFWRLMALVLAAGMRVEHQGDASAVLARLRRELAERT